MEVRKMSTTRFDAKRPLPVYEFSTAFDLGKECDMRSAVEKFPDGVVLCCSDLIAGNEHILGIIAQTVECSRRNLPLARSKSIEMLMRITCRAQISEAIEVSRLSNVENLAVFGLVESEVDAKETERTIVTIVAEAGRNDELLSLSKRKEAYLKEIHQLPRRLTREELLTALIEKSALLVFAR